MHFSKKITVCFLAVSLLIVGIGFCFAQTKVANDPTRICVGARPLGMGKSFVAIANDSSAIYMNPAGLGWQQGLKLNSMSSKFISEVNYLSLSSLYGTNYGTIGIAYVGSSLGFVTPTTTLELVNGVYRVIELTGESQSYAYNNDVMLLSYGVPLKGLGSWDQLNNLYFGANAKIFSQGISGRGVNGGIASGFDMDFGMLYVPSSWISLGLVMQNALPMDLGGKLTWPVTSTRTREVVEDIAPVAKLGVACKLLGEGAPFKSGDNELVYSLDFEYLPGKVGVPSLIHTGFEWWPVSVMALRMGIDQDFLGSGGGVFEVSSNFTAGVGLYYEGFGFDYAYHQYNSLPQNDTHYLSISYALFPPGPKKAETQSKVMIPQRAFISLNSPLAEDLVLYQETLKISGKVLEEDVSSVRIGDQRKELKGATSFEAAAQLNIGKNVVVVKAFDSQGKDLQTINLKLLRLRAFTDINKEYFAKKPIEYLSTLNIIAGYPDGSFKPEGTLTRAELATLLVKAKGATMPETSTASFKDLPANHWAAPYVKAAVDSGYVKGYPNGTFQPQKSISRVEGILVVSRFAGLQDTSDLTEGPFPDMPGRHWAARTVDSAKKAGLLDYLDGKILKPDQELTRGEAAEMIAKTPQMTALIQPLVSYDTGYQNIEQSNILYFNLAPAGR
ncbi:MAG: S-layer homology domain-containing protein [Candidatus Saganbacteria bacterium]|nr:S-layer homology domain-containing protein [Candidatus Saganbacteria bacterium]